MHPRSRARMGHMEFSPVMDGGCCRALREFTHFARGRFRTLLSCRNRLFVLKMRSRPRERQERQVDCSGIQRLLMEVSEI